jgi:hypothetical protein
MAAIIFIITFSLIQATLAMATNFTQCFADFQSGRYGTSGGTDAHGNPVTNISTAVGFTYELCKIACETGPEPFDWFNFSQQFSAWLLPWLALISLLPFGAGDIFENLTSVLLAVGSPTLAAYSLALTALNRRWAAQRFSDISYPNVDLAFHVMSGLQQAPLKIVNEDGLFHSLVVLYENDGWWRMLVNRLDYAHSWSISAVTSILWVLLAYLFTVIGAFNALPRTPAGVTIPLSSDGQSVGTVWLWLLPIVVGWLQMSPKCESQRIKNALRDANAIAHVATDHGAQRIKSEARAFTMNNGPADALHVDERYTAPIFNYARILPWTQNVEEVVEVFRHAAHHAQAHKPVDHRLSTSQWVEGADSEFQIDPKNRQGNLEQVMDYCTSPIPFPNKRSHWGPDVWSRLLNASFAALMLQWGTAGAAIIIIWFTPTVGLGCRSGSYLVYAAASTLTWILLVTSSILTHSLAYPTVPTSCASSANKPCSDKDEPFHPGQQWPCLRSFVRLLAITFRRSGKLLAAGNAIWIVLSCTLQFGNFYNRCYCNSSVTGLRGGAFDTIIPAAGDLLGPWIGGVALACGSAAVFVGFINLFIHSKPTRSP